MTPPSDPMAEVRSILTQYSNQIRLHNYGIDHLHTRAQEALALLTEHLNDRTR